MRVTDDNKLDALRKLASEVRALVDDAYDYSENAGMCGCGSDERYCHWDSHAFGRHVEKIRAFLARCGE